MYPLSITFSMNVFSYDADADIHLLMDEIIDDQLIGRDMNGTVVGGPPLVSGVWGNALSFNGVNQYVQLDNNFCFTQIPMCPSGMTWSLWINFPGIPNSSQFLISAGHGRNTAITGVVFRTKTNGQLVVSTHSNTLKRITFVAVGSYPVNEWMHVGIIYQPDEDIKLYINGSLAAGTNTESQPADNTGGGLFELGRSFTDEMYCHATMDELLFWSHAKDDAFMQQIYILQRP